MRAALTGAAPRLRCCRYMNGVTSDGNLDLHRWGQSFR